MICCSSVLNSSERVQQTESSFWIPTVQSDGRHLKVRLSGSHWSTVNQHIFCWWRGGGYIKIPPETFIWLVFTEESLRAIARVKRTWTSWSSWRHFSIPRHRSGLIYSGTVLSGAEERGVDGPSLDRSYFSRLQPISFLIYNIRLRVT